MNCKLLSFCGFRGKHMPAMSIAGLFFIQAKKTQVFYLCYKKFKLLIIKPLIYSPRLSSSQQLIKIALTAANHYFV